MALDSDQQQQQQSNAVKYSVRAIRYLGIPLVSLLLCPFAIAGAIIFGTLFAGPLVYYRSTILNSDALTEKYDKEGVRLQGKIIKLVDVSYGGENGFNQAIELAADCLNNVKFIQEKKLINNYFDQISQDTGKYCFGVEAMLYSSI